MTEGSTGTVKNIFQAARPAHPAPGWSLSSGSWGDGEHPGVQLWCRHRWGAGMEKDTQLRVPCRLALGFCLAGIGNLGVTLWSCVTLPIDCTGPVLTSEPPCSCWAPGILDSARSTREVPSRCSESGPLFLISTICVPLTLEVILLCHSSPPERRCSTLQGLWKSWQTSLPSSSLCAVALSELKAQGQGRRQGRTSEARPKERHEMVLHISNEKGRLTF